MSADRLLADRILAARLAEQRLTSAPFADTIDAVRLLTCVQAQDAPLARYSLGLRTAADDDAVKAALDGGAIVRTHILRPTWHFVAADDVRWILGLTSPKVETTMAARYRQLELTDEITERAIGLLCAVLAGRRFMTRPELGALFAEAGLPSAGEQVGHLLMRAELRAVICSGPLRGSTHTYGLVDELIPPSPPLDRPDAIRRLVERFFGGHGPAADTDLNRWTKLTLTEIRHALGELSAQAALTATTIDGSTLWCAPEPPPPTAPHAPRAFLLPLFDEAHLTYPTLNFPRVADHPRGDLPPSFAEAGGGIVVFDRHDVGSWKRKEVGRTTVVRLTVAASLGTEERALVHDAAARLAAFTGRTPDIIDELR